MGVLAFGSGAALLTGITIRTGIPAWTAQTQLRSRDRFQLESGWNGKMVFRGGYGLNYNQGQIAKANNYGFNPPGFSSVPGTSKGPTQINPNILYAISRSPTNIFGFPANPSAISTFNSAGLPTAGGANIGALPGHLPTEYAHHYSLDMEWTWGIPWLPIWATLAARAITTCTTMTPTP